MSSNEIRQDEDNNDSCDGIDDIDSGDGDNFVSSGRADVDGDGNTDLDVVKEHMNSHQDIFDDDDWI